MTITKHPAYGTCTGCTQGKGIDKFGRIKPHTRVVSFGHAVATVDCDGSRGPYAEVSRTEWNSRLSRWQDMPLNVAITEHDDNGEQAAAIEVHSFPDSKKGHQIFVDRGMSLHFFLVSEEEHGRSTWRGELRDADGVALKTSGPKANDGSVNGLVLGWLSELGSDTAPAGGAR